MKLYYLQYYKDFRCIAAACPDSCCKEWTVDVDPEAAAMYRALPGALGDRLRAVLKDTPEGTVMEIENGRCPMWQQDSLCRIQATLGHDALCQTCRDFPRLRHDYGDFVELGLELSCPEAARLILSNGDQEILVTTQPNDTEAEYDAEAMAILRRSRKSTLDFLSSADCTVPQALAAILLYAHDVQEELDGADPTSLSPADCLPEVSQYIGQGNIVGVFDFFKSLEILTPLWEFRLQEGPVPVAWTPVFRALARYFIARYWLQAVSDYDLVCRVKLMIVACLLIGALGGDPVQTAQLFSKEIENDPDNLDAILDAAYTEPALADRNLLGLLLP